MPALERWAPRYERSSYEVALILNLNKDFDRKVAASISRYAHAAGNWRIYLEDELANRMPAFEHWRGHGVIAAIEDEQVLRRVRRLNIPVVGIGGSPAHLVPAELSCVRTDNVRIGQLAAEHLLELGLRHFAFCGVPISHYNAFSREREEAFAARLQAAGFECAAFHGRHRRTTKWNSLLAELATWLREHPGAVAWREALGMVASMAEAAAALTVAGVLDRRGIGLGGLGDVLGGEQPRPAVGAVPCPWP